MNVLKYVTILAAAGMLIPGCTWRKTEAITPAAPAGNTGGCDSVNVSYASRIIPIMNANCYSCHATAVVSVSGGLDLQDFSSLKNYLSYQYHADGIYGSKFMHIVNQTSGVIPMPPTGKLSDCDIAALQSWIRAGAPQN